MTMPVKIYAGHHGYGTYWQTNVSDGGATYIRADIAEELARAFSHLLQSVLEDEDGIAGLDATVSGHEVLDRYRTITP